MEARVKSIITDVLSTRLLKEILCELTKYDAWKRNLLRGLIKSKQPNPINRDQLDLFARSEKQRLDDAAVHLQYVFLPTLLHPEQEIQAPFATTSISGLTEPERRIELELQKLSEWVLKRDELDERFKTFLSKSKSKVPVHKQDHEPVRRCPNPKCNNMALFKHTPDSLVCVSCGMKQTYLDNNIAYGEEVMWRETKTRKDKKDEIGKEAAISVKQLLSTPHLLKQTPKKFDLSQMFHYNVEAPTPLATAHSMLTKDMLQHIQTNSVCQRLQKQWNQQPSASILVEAMRVWKQYLKQIQFSHTPVFVFIGVSVLLQWTPPAIAPEVHAELSQTLYTFDTALSEYQQLHPEDSNQVHKIRSSNFRKYVLLQITHMQKPTGTPPSRPQSSRPEHFRYFITLSKHDKLNRLYDLAFQLICHYIDTQRV